MFKRQSLTCGIFTVSKTVNREKMVQWKAITWTTVRLYQFFGYLSFLTLFSSEVSKRRCFGTELNNHWSNNNRLSLKRFHRLAVLWKNAGMQFESVNKYLFTFFVSGMIPAKLFSWVKIYSERYISKIWVTSHVVIVN